MAIDPVTLGVAGAALLGQGINAASTGNANRKNREFQREMYDRQYQDALKMWNMSNTYNSPQEQMKRLQAAGLNPNLIYGSGGQTGGTASPPPVPSAGSYSHMPTKFDLGGAAVSAFDAFYNQQMKEAQLDNLKAQNDVITQEALLKQTQRENMSFDLAFKGDARIDDLDFRKARAADLGNRSVISANQAEIILATKPATIQMALENVLSKQMDRKAAEARIREIDANVDLKRMDAELRQNGVTYSDPYYLRVIGRLLESTGVTPDRTIEAVKKMRPVQGTFQKRN